MFRNIAIELRGIYGHCALREIALGIRGGVCRGVPLTVQKSLTVSPLESHTSHLTFGSACLSQTRARLASVSLLRDLCFWAWHLMPPSLCRLRLRVSEACETSPNGLQSSSMGFQILGGSVSGIAPPPTVLPAFSGSPSFLVHGSKGVRFVSPRSLAALRTLTAQRLPTAPLPHYSRSRASVLMAGHTFFATCPKGLGSVLAREVESSAVGGVVTKELPSGVEFTADSLVVGYAACLWLRTAIRVLALIGRTDDYYEEAGVAKDYDSLYAFVRGSTDWGALLRGGEASFSVQVREPPAVSTRQAVAEGVHVGIRRGRDGRRGAGAVVRGVFGTHRAQVCAKDAICDALRDASLPVPERPSSHAESDVPLFLALNGSEASLYRDMAGMSLHKRFVAFVFFNTVFPKCG